MGRVVVTATTSHRRAMRTIVDALADRGHEVELITGLEPPTGRALVDQHRRLCRLLAESGTPTVVVGDVAFQGTLPLSYGAPGPKPAALILVGTEPFSLSSIDTAPAGLGLLPDRTAAGRERNRRAYEYVRDALGGVQAEFVEAMRSVGVTHDPLPFVLDAPILAADRFLQLSVEELSYRRSDTPSHVRFVGALPSTRIDGDVVISDGTFDTVQRALRQAKPLVLTGRSAEQLEGNTRAAATGAALYLATDKPSEDDIKQAVRIVLTDPTYRGNAERLAAEYARLDALASITDAAESYLRQ
ncbi:MAG TPA: nucleotide disphospho-sugar-binding domain-containing protein [Kutzneria sp.]|jgi:hypothetical protein